MLFVLGHHSTNNYAKAINGVLVRRNAVDAFSVFKNLCSGIHVALYLGEVIKAIYFGML